jgi:anti-anti-sigma factor
MALLPGTLSRAGPLSSDILDLQVTEYGRYTRVVTVVGEIDALTAPELVTFLIAQLIGAPLVVVNLDGVRFLSSTGLRACSRQTNSLSEKIATCDWCVTPRLLTGHWRPLDCGSTSHSPTTCPRSADPCRSGWSPSRPLTVAWP